MKLGLRPAPSGWPASAGHQQACARPLTTSSTTRCILQHQKLSHGTAIGPRMQRCLPCTAAKPDEQGLATTTVVQQAGGKEELTPAELTWPARTHGAGMLRVQQVGEEGIVLCGWVDKNRDMGGVQFFDIRDHTGIMQASTHARVVCEPQSSPEVARIIGRLRSEYVVCVKGSLRARRDPNKKIPTGDVELLASEVGTGGWASTHSAGWVICDSRSLKDARYGLTIMNA
eukprot:1157272-Pelagomonas_calceolata.AAC.4